MIAYRLLRIFIHVLVGMWTCALVFSFSKTSDRSQRIRRWSLQLLAICGVQVEVQNRADVQTPRALMIANHVSWLDIFVINAYEPCHFVAKSDIRDWPLLGWLCAEAGTIFIARGKVRDVRRIFEGLVTSIQAGQRVAFFPEGTTGAQGTILPFHANLFEAAIDAQVPIQPYAIRYTDTEGKLHATVNFIGEMTFAQSIVSILRTKNIRAQLIILPVIETTGMHRRELATVARRSIADALGYAEI